MVLHLVRGSSALLICPDAARRDAVYRQLQELLGAGPLRWSVSVCATGGQLHALLASGRLPAVVAADLAGFEEELLVGDRADRFLAALDLVLVDRFHEFTGPAELHLGLSLQRLWLLLSRFDRPTALPRVIATAGPFANAGEWATGTLGRLVTDIRFESGAPALPALETACTSDRPVRLVNRPTASTLLVLDREVAFLSLFPGAILLLRDGRFVVDGREAPDGTLEAMRVDAPARTFAERRFQPDADDVARLIPQPRELGPTTLRCSRGRVRIRATTSAVSTHVAGRPHDERREIVPALETVIDTDALLVSRPGVDPEALGPLASVLALALPSVLRTARDLVFVAPVDDGAEGALLFFDRTPGGNGACRAIESALLPELLAVAGAMLRGPAEPLLNRLAREANGGGELPGAEQLDAALRWLVPGADDGIPADARDPAAGAVEPPVDPALLPATWSGLPVAERLVLLERIAAFGRLAEFRGAGAPALTAEERLRILAPLAFVFGKRPDLVDPRALSVEVETSDELHRVPGATATIARSDGSLELHLAGPARGPSAGEALGELAGRILALVADPLAATLANRSPEERRRWLDRQAAAIGHRAATRGAATTTPEDVLASAVAALLVDPAGLRLRAPETYAALRTALRVDPAGKASRTAKGTGTARQAPGRAAR